MSIQIPASVTSFMRVEFTSAGHPEFDRAILLPQTAPMEWIFDAYLLSMGREPLEKPEFYDESDDYQGYPRLDPESIDRWRTAMLELGHRIDVTVRVADAPPMGAPLVSASSTISSPAADGDWTTAAAPFRENDVNRELMRRHGVVMPSFDDRDMRDVDPRIRRSSRIATLLGALTPARRLALLAHVDAIGLVRDSVPDHATVESAVAPLAGLLRHLGGAGIVQDPETGWVSRSDVEKLTRSLGWSGESDETRQRADTIIAFARRAKLIRRLKGRIVATAHAKSLIQPTRNTLGALAEKIGASTRERYGIPLPRRDAEGTLALLSVADGTVNHLDELAARVAAGTALFDATDSIYGSDQLDRLFAARIRGEVGEKSDEITQLSAGLASLSAPEKFGTVTPAMREVARRALV